MQLDVLERIRGGLIVSCQALPEEPLHSSSSWPHGRGRPAGRRRGIRANSAEDIAVIKSLVDLPLIGIVKREYAGCPVYITPTLQEVDALAQAGCEIIALDATQRPRPRRPVAGVLFRPRPGQISPPALHGRLLLYEEGMAAAALGFDLIGTTLSGYTPYTQGAPSPNLPLMATLVKNCGKPVIAEGGIWTPEQLRLCLDCGVHAAVVGTAITVPWRSPGALPAALLP